MKTMRIPAARGLRLPPVVLTIRVRDVRLRRAGVGPTALLLALPLSLLALPTEAEIPCGAATASVQPADLRLGEEIRRLERERLTLAEVRRMAREKEQEELRQRAAAALQQRTREPAAFFRTTMVGLLPGMTSSPTLDRKATEEAAVPAGRTPRHRPSRRAVP
jgi:hypothetical protein